MIKINLLPTKKRPPRKVTELQQQLILGMLILGLLALGMFTYWKALNSEIASLQGQKAAAQARIQEQTAMLKQVEKVESERKQVKEKIDIIEKLQKNREINVHLLDEVSKALPKGVNLTSLTEKESKIKIEGMAFTNDVIVRFVDNLKASPYCNNVTLIETVRNVVEGFEVYKYKLEFQLKEE